MRLSRLWQCREPLIWAFDFAARHRVVQGTRRRLETSQTRRFRRLMRHVARRSPYYRAILRERELDPATCRPEQFPVLTRRQLIEHFDEIVTDRTLTRRRMEAFCQASHAPTKLLDDRYFVIHSSGTSGNRVFMAYSPREWIRGVSHQMRFAGGLRWRKRCAFIGLIRDHFGGYTMATTARRGINRFFFDCRGIDMTLSTRAIVDRLNTIQPHVLSAYSSVLAAMADEQVGGRLKIQPRCIVSSGEMLLPEQRRYIETVFRTPVMDVYAATEILVLAMAGPPGESMTLLEDDFLLELHDDHYYVTSLYHRTVPLIRYRMEDALRMVPQTGTQPLRKVERVVGRSCELLSFVNNDGAEDSIPSFMLLGMHVRGVTQFQLEYQGLQSFSFRVKLEPRLSRQQRDTAVREVHAWLRQSLKDKSLDRSVRFSVKAVDEIPADPRTGKVRMVLHPSERQRAA